MPLSMVVTRHVTRALAAELAERWQLAADCWLDAFVCATKDGADGEARTYLANMRAADKAAAAAAAAP